MGASGPSDLPPDILVFPDRKHQGRFPVRDADSRVVAEISTSWTGLSFSAVDGAGQPLCAGSVRALGLSGRWRATGPDRAELLSVTKSFWRSQAELRLARGGVSVLRGSAWRRDFAVTDADDATVLAATPRTSALSLRPYDFAVRQSQGGFSLPETVALVQIWRMVRKSEDAAAAGAVTAGVAATSG